MTHRHRWLAVPITIAMLGLAGCSRHQTAPPVAPEPAQAQSIQGSDLHRVIVTESAMQQLGIRTEPVRAAPAAGNGQPALTVIPVTAIIYDPQGRSWTYTTPEAGTFVRQAIVIDHIDGPNAFLRSGPALGLPVVTVGASELLGVEYGVGEE